MATSNLEFATRVKGHSTGTERPATRVASAANDLSLRVKGEPSAADAVTKVGDATLSFENPDPLQLALFDAEVLEQPPPIAH